MARNLRALPWGAEARMLRGLWQFLKQDVILKEFHPWILIDVPELDKFVAYGAWSATVQPLGLNWKDKPTSQQDVVLNAGVSFFLPYEEAKSDSELLSLRLGRYLAGRVYTQQTFQDPDEDPDFPNPMNFACTSVRPLQPISGRSTGVRILTWSVELLTNVDPQTGRIE